MNEKRRPRTVKCGGAFVVGWSFGLAHRHAAVVLGMRPGTRMAAFFSGGKSARTDVLDGDASQQIDAIWTYLSLGAAMPLPAGLVVDPATYDLDPIDRPMA